MGTSYQVDLIYGVPFKMENRPKEVQKFDENTGKPYTRMVDDYTEVYVPARLIKPFTVPDPADDVYDDWVCAHKFGADSGAMGIRIIGIDPNYDTFELVDTDTKDVRNQFIDMVSNYFEINAAQKLIGNARLLLVNTSC